MIFRDMTYLHTVFLVQKALGLSEFVRLFWLAYLREGLSAGGGGGGGLIGGSKKGKWDDRHQERWIVSYYLSIYTLKKCVPETVPLWLKTRNQRIHTGKIMRGGGAYTWSNVSVKEKVRLSAGAYTRGGGLIGGEKRYIKTRAKLYFSWKNWHK